MVYKFKTGSNISGNAEEVYNAIQSIGEKATPAEIVDKARASSSVLHQYFTWDDSVASRNWRVQEARSLVASIVIVPVETAEENPRIVRAFESVKGDSDERGYVKREAVIQNEKYAEEVEKEICSLIESLIERLRSYEDVPSMSRKITNAISRIRGALNVVRE